MKEYIKTLDKNLKYVKHELVDDTYYIYCETKTKEFKHPEKDIKTKSVKHRYTRNVDDIPFNGKKVRLIIKVKVFLFRSISNEKNQFVENLDFLSDDYQRSRRTKRLESFILDFANNGSAISTEKTLKRSGVRISDTSINRMFKKKEKKQTNKSSEKNCD